MNTKEHYDKHLGKFYSWMIGDFETKSKEQFDFLKSHGITPKNSRVAIDLGAGNGIQTLALARLGYDVIAVDFNTQLISELRSAASGLKVTVFESDLLNFDTISGQVPEVITCMGDTILHLSSCEELKVLFSKVFQKLQCEGKFVISFRDYTTELFGENRFIPVKSDTGRILTCFLEYFNDYVLVTDLLYEYEDNKWVQKISSYKKLRIGTDSIKELLERCGFKIVSSEILNRMVYIIASKQH